MAGGTNFSKRYFTAFVPMPRYAGMVSLPTTIEEFAANGYTHIESLSALSCDAAAADELACSHLDGPDQRSYPSGFAAPSAAGRFSRLSRDDWKMRLGRRG